MGEAEGVALKDPYVVMDRVRAMYRSLGKAEQTEANAVFAKWLMSDDDRIWGLGMDLIRDLHIVATVPALHGLADKFRRSQKPGAPMWVETVEQLIRDLQCGVQ
jgi:hypothetical protein